MNPVAERLRADLASIADRVTSVDLRDRVLYASRRLAIRRTVAVSVATAAAIAAAGTAVALLPGRQTATPLPATRSASATPSASTAYGVVTMAELTAEPVRIPAWTTPNSGCPSGRVRLAQGQGPINHSGDLRQLRVYQVVQANLDSDGSPETAALISCQFAEAAVDQVVAFDRGPSGQILTLGKVVEGTLWNLTAPAANRVAVDISDFEACCTTPKAVELHQIRAYGWAGAKFAQVAGPATFFRYQGPTTLKVSVDAVTYGARHGDKRTATVKITVSNTGSHSADSFVVLDSDSPCCVQAGFQSQHGPLAAGAQQHLTLTYEYWFALDQQITLFAYEMGSQKFRCVAPETCTATLALKKN
jgi:hypothetical protein